MSTSIAGGNLSQTSHILNNLTNFLSILFTNVSL